MGINISKPTLSATDYVVLLSGMPEMLQNSTVTWKMISLLCKLNSLSSTISIIFINYLTLFAPLVGVFNYNYNYNYKVCQNT